MINDPRRYMQIANGLREQIRDGGFKPGDPVPDIANICHETGYSRQTAGKALRLLESEGLLTRIPGLGYHVR
jgi:DNA-binding GntR family transcriptional regulator